MNSSPELAGDHYLEVHARLDLVCQHLGNRLVKGSDDFHGSLRLDAPGVDQVVEGVNEGHADAAAVSATETTETVVRQYLLPR